MNDKEKYIRAWIFFRISQTKSETDRNFLSYELILRFLADTFLPSKFHFHPFIPSILISVHAICMYICKKVCTRVWVWPRIRTYIFYEQHKFHTKYTSMSFACLTLVDISNFMHISYFAGVYKIRIYILPDYYSPNVPLPLAVQTTEIIKSVAFS